MNIKDFNELVWDFGANGITNPSFISESKWQIVALAWAASNRTSSTEEADDVINSYYKDFMNA